MDKRYLNIEQLGDALEVSRSWIYTMIRDRKIPFIKMGKSVRFDMKSIEAWLTKNEIKAAPKKETLKCLAPADIVAPLS